jgi:hypothetical protein
VRQLGPRVHEGRILAGEPNEIWGTDAAKVWATEEGWATAFVAVDHGTGELVGIRAAKVGNRSGALEELRLALQEWVRVYHEHWLIERHGYRSPLEVRREYLALQEAA